MNKEPSGYLLLSFPNFEHTNTISNEQLYMQNPDLIPDDYLLIIIANMDKDNDDRYKYFIEVLTSKNYIYHGEKGYKLYFIKSINIDHEYMFLDQLNVTSGYDLLGNVVLTSLFEHFPRQTVNFKYTADKLLALLPCIIRGDSGSDEVFDDLAKQFIVKPLLPRDSITSCLKFYIIREHVTKGALHKKNCRIVKNTNDNGE